MSVLRLAAAMLLLAVPVHASADAPGPSAVKICASPTRPEVGCERRSDRVHALRMGTWGIDTAGMETRIRPGDDFFGYVNGNWARNTRIPSDRSQFGSFAILEDLTEARVRNLIEGYMASAPPNNGDQAKVAAFYRSYMDEEAIEEADAQPLVTRLDPVRKASGKRDLARIMGRTLGGLGGSFFAARVGDDAKNPGRFVLMLRQGSLGLGDRDMYLDVRFRPQKQRYEQYIGDMLGLAGWPSPRQSARDIVMLETRLAHAHWTLADGRDRDRTYTPVTPAELEQLAPSFPWEAFLRGAGLEEARRIVLVQNTAFPRIAKIFGSAELRTLKAWLAFRLTDDVAPLLSKRFRNRAFEFRSKFLEGQPVQKERWKLGIAAVEAAMGEAVGRDYVGRYFKPDAKAKMEVLVGNIRAAMRARLERLSWMTPATKQEALKKLAALRLKVGYPAEWRSYSGLNIVEGDVVGNVERGWRFDWDFRRRRLNQPVPTTELDMYPQMPNAYYFPVRSELGFPAAILQPPFFDADADPAVNYGGIGGVIGHELVHAFDDEGRKFDWAGRLRDWWHPQDSARFAIEAKRLGEQYASYKFPTLPGMHINPQNTMGENIADLGGVLLALDAYRISLGGEPARVIDGFTGEQRVLMAWAQIWRGAYRDDALRQLLIHGPHSPGPIRAFAPLRNSDAWYEAFKVKPGDKLYIAPAHRVRIW